MPKATFYNLPREKQNKVIQAAREEFVRAKDGEILIKNIVISAGIPRGSFYQYFETKEDLVKLNEKGFIEPLTFKDIQNFGKEEPKKIFRKEEE